MVDVVANHVGPVYDDFAQITPYNSPSDYHENCDIVDWSNQWQVENCRLFSLPDINQENPSTRQSLLNWIKDLVSKYNFDGIRIDTVSEVPKDFWVEYA